MASDDWPLIPRRKTDMEKRIEAPYVPEEELDACIEWISGGGTIAQFCREPGRMSKSTFYRLIAMDKDFGDRYARARDPQLRAWEDDLIDTAYDIGSDLITRVDRKGNTYQTLDKEHVTRSALIIETKKWLMARANSTRYGNKVAHVGSAEDDPIKLEHSSPRAELEAKLDTMGKRTK